MLSRSRRAHDAHAAHAIGHDASVHHSWLERASVERIRWKYGELLALRAERAGGASVAPKARLAELAGRFPGCLRELDLLAPDVLGERAHVAHAIPPPRWLLAVVAHHALLRHVLAARGLARLPGEPALDEAAQRLLRSHDSPSESGVAPATLDVWGRPSRVVRPWVARAANATDEELDSLLLPRAPAPESPESH